MDGKSSSRRRWSISPEPHAGPAAIPDGSALRTEAADEICAHPFFPVVKLLLRKCAAATQFDPSRSSLEFRQKLFGIDDVVKQLTSCQASAAASFAADGTQTSPQVDTLVFTTIYVLRLHLYELEKVWQYSERFYERYIEFIKSRCTTKSNISSSSIPSKTRNGHINDAGSGHEADDNDEMEEANDDSSSYDYNGNEQSASKQDAVLNSGIGDENISCSTHDPISNLSTEPADDYAVKGGYDSGCGDAANTAGISQQIHAINAGNFHTLAGTLWQIAHEQICDTTREEKLPQALSNSTNQQQCANGEIISRKRKLPFSAEEFIIEKTPKLGN